MAAIALNVWVICPSALTVALAEPAQTYPLYPITENLGENLLENEQALVEQSARAVEALIQKRYQQENVVGRGDHSTPHGCYPARLTLDRTLPEALSVGIAHQAKGGEGFDAVVRWSNSDTADVPDRHSASQGMAVKVYMPSKVDPTQFLFPDKIGEQDFLAGSSSTFMFKSVADYAPVFERRVDPSFMDYLKILFGHPNVVYLRLIKPRLPFQEPPLILKRRFWSSLPYAWGNGAAKFRFEPCHAADISSIPVDAEHPRYQEELIEAALKDNELCFEFQVQLRPADASEMTYPIEDATVFWPTGASAPYVKVATITIPQGQQALEKQACERLEFNPWNGLKAHQPLGNLNRARLSVYKQSHKTRSELYEMPAKQ
jgi:hypothetical protein